MKNDKRKFFIGILIAFGVLNVILFSAAVTKEKLGEEYSATFWNASDGQRYWGVAINVAEKGEFSIATADDEPLSRAGPLPALLFAAPIKAVGVDRAPIWIVGFQCTLLAIMGWLAKQITPGRRETKDLAQLLVMFNPNLIGLAHHAQSDLIFAFFLAVMLFAGVTMINQGKEKVISMFVLSGFAAGGLTLSRPAGQFFVVVFPLFMLIALTVHRRANGIYWKKYFIGAILYVSLFSALVLPWAVRNYVVLGDFGLSQSEAIMMRDQYKFLLRFSGVSPSDRSSALRNAGENYILSKGADPTCLDRLRDSDCKSLMTKAYLSAIFDLPPSQIGRGLISAWTTLYFGPATGRIAKYIGIEPRKSYEVLIKKFSGFSSYKVYLETAIADHSKYAVLLILFSGFVFLTRLFGIIGLVRMFAGRDNRAIGIIFLLTLGLFSAMYLCVGISRYRAPLEIMLMILAATGYQYVRDLPRFRRPKNV
jgi:hypothetical protein